MKANNANVFGMIFGPSVPRWIRSLVGHSKCDSDASIYTQKGKSTVGAVHRNSNGEFVVGFSAYMDVVLNPRMLETLALREVLSWLKDNNGVAVDIGMDAKVEVDAVRYQIWMIC